VVIVWSNKRLQPTIASVTPCADAQAAPATLAAEAHVRMTRAVEYGANRIANRGGHV